LQGGLLNSTWREAPHGRMRQSKVRSDKHARVCSRSYIKQSLGGPTPAEVESIVAERDQLRSRVQQLEAQIEELKAQQVRQSAA
jgi:hypothetical protein